MDAVEVIFPVQLRRGGYFGFVSAKKSIDNRNALGLRSGRVQGAHERPCAHERTLGT